MISKVIKFTFNKLKLLYVRNFENCQSKLKNESNSFQHIVGSLYLLMSKNVCNYQNQIIVNTFYLALI